MKRGIKRAQGREAEDHLLLSLSRHGVDLLKAEQKTQSRTAEREAEWDGKWCECKKERKKERTTRGNWAAIIHVLQ